MKIVLDTNILLISLPKKSPFRPIFDAIRTGLIQVGISSEILLEYEEILIRKTSSGVAENVIKILVNLENVHHQDIYFNWNLIQSDADDNKFVDCALAFSADFLVTNDKHFDILKSIDFPKLAVIPADKLLDLISKL